MLTAAGTSGQGKTFVSKRKTVQVINIIPNLQKRAGEPHENRSQHRRQAQVSDLRRNLPVTSGPGGTQADPLQGGRLRPMLALSNDPARCAQLQGPPIPAHSTGVGDFLDVVNGEERIQRNEFRPRAGTFPDPVHLLSPDAQL